MEDMEHCFRGHILFRVAPFWRSLSEVPEFIQDFLEEAAVAPSSTRVRGPLS